MLILLFVALFSSACIKGDDPCLNYEKFDNEERRDTNYELRPSDRQFSDRYLRDAWYGSALHITTVMPPKYVCGTLFPVWTKEEVANGDGTVNMTMCIHAKENCTVQFVVKAKHCQTHTVYFLEHTPMDSAYCLAAQANVPQFDHIPAVDLNSQQVDRLSNALCRFENHEEDVFYVIFWYVNNTFCHHSARHQWLDWEENNKLNKSMLINECVSTASFNVTCAVRTSYNDMPGGSVPVFSQPYTVDVTDYCFENGQCIVKGSVCPSLHCLLCNTTETGLMWMSDHTIADCNSANVMFIHMSVMMVGLLVIFLF